MVAEKNPPNSEVVSDDDDVDEDVQERQESVRYNQILRQGTFLLLFWKVFPFLPPIYLLLFLANEEISREIDVAVGELVQLEADIVQHEQELYIQEQQLLAMIYHERERRLALHSSRDPTLESEPKKNDSEDCSKK